MATLKIKANKANNESVNAAKQVSNPESESPVMKQYREQKAKNPNAILLFRCGDFYETYFEDAAAAAEVLGITLTKKGDGTTMAGFPHHALDKYLPMLIRAGKRVAICDQLESEELRVKSEELQVRRPEVESQSATAPKTDEPVKVDEYTVKDDAGNDVKFETVVPAAISEQPANDNANDNANANAEEVIVDVAANLPKVEFSTYTTKKGNTAPQIIGFGGEDDPRWQSHKDAGHKYVSASWKKDLNGEKVYILMFGTRYMDVAKALAGAYNTNDREAWKRAEDACMAIYEQAQRDGKARWEAKKAEWKQKADERKAKKEADRKCYTKEDVAAMLNDLLAGKDIPEDIKRLLPKAA